MAGDFGLGSCDGCDAMDRRAFLERTALAAVAAFLAGCAMGDTTGPSSFQPFSITVSDYPALASVGGIARVDGGSGPPVAAVHSGAGQFAAFSMVCPHQGGTIGIVAGGFLCPNHGARFASNGGWIGGQRTSSLHAYATQFDPQTGVLAIG